MQYSSALKILNKMFSFVEVLGMQRFGHIILKPFLSSIFNRIFIFLDETLKQSLTLLLAEALLRVHQPDKALSIITYIENLMHQIESSKRNYERNQEESEAPNTVRIVRSSFIAILGKVTDLFFSLESIGWKF